MSVTKNVRRIHAIIGYKTLQTSKFEDFISTYFPY
jgi:hypothetical protein